MADRSFQDDLNRLHAANARDQEHADQRAGRQRAEDYQAGQGAAANIISRVAIYGRAAGSSAVALQMAARHQGSDLAGRVAAGALADRADDYRRQAQLDAERESLEEAARVRSEAIRREHYNRAAHDDRNWYRGRER